MSKLLDRENKVMVASKIDLDLYNKFVTRLNKENKTITQVVTDLLTLYSKGAKI